MTLDVLLNHSYSGAMENIFTNKKCTNCYFTAWNVLLMKKKRALLKFLADDAGRERIYLAKILLQHIGDPITIKT